MNANPYPSVDDATFHAVAEGAYRKSSYSNGNGHCVSVAAVDGLVGLQDDKLPPSERKARTLVFTPAEMRAFIQGAKHGEFDHLLD